MIPYTDHSNNEVRTKSRTFSNHYLSIAASFCPKAVVKILSKDRSFSAYPSGQAILLTWFVNALSSIPNDRKKYIELCQDMVYHSSPAALKNVPFGFWNFLREHLTVSDLNSILIPLSHPDLSHAAAYICQIDMKNMAPRILSIASMNFVSRFISNLRVGIDQFDITCVCERVADSLQESNSSTVSGGIEVLIQLLHFLWWKLSTEESMYLAPLCYTMLRLVDTQSTLIIHKASCIEALVVASTINVFSIDDVLPFTSFDKNESSPIRQTALKISFKLLNIVSKRKEIFDLFINVTEERDPILFVLFLELFTENYDDLKYVDEELVFKLLNLSLIPLPTYYVEQNRIIKLFTKIPIKDLTDSRLKFNVNLILHEFIKKPHPTVISEIKTFIDKKNSDLYTIKISDLYWFDDNVQYSFQFINDCDPNFMIELLDSLIIPANCLPNCLKILQKHSKIIANLCVDQIIILINKCMKVMGFKERLKNVKENLIDKKWIRFKTLNNLYSLMNSLIVDSVFGKIFESLISTLISFLDYIEIDLKYIITLIDFCITISDPFCSSACKLLLQANNVFNNSKIIITDNLLIQIKKKNKMFFDSVSTEPVSIVFAGIELLGPEQTLITCHKIIKQAIINNGKIAKQFLALFSQPISEMSTLSSFAEIEKRVEMIELCKTSIQKNPDLNNQENNTPIYLRKFKFNEPKIQDGFKLHTGFVSSLYSLISFLWFSDLDLPSEMSYETIETFCIDNGQNSRLSIGFLAYSIRKNRKINIDKWCSSFALNVNDELSIISAILIFSCINCKWEDISEHVRSFINRCLKAIGATEFDDDFIYHMYTTENGVNKELIRSIISIDESHFPLIQTNSRRNEKLQDIINGLPNSIQVNPIESFSNLCYYLCDVSDFDQRPKLLIPKMKNIPEVFLYFNDLHKPQHFRSGFLRSLFDTLLSIDNVPICFLTILPYFDLEESQMSSLLDKSVKSSPLSFNLSNTNQTTDSKPPSYFKLISRIQHNPNVNYKSKMLRCFGDNVSMLAKIRYGTLDKKEITEVMSSIQYTNFESIEIFHSLLDTISSYGCNVFAETDISVVVFQITKQLCDQALTKNLNLFYVVDIFNEVIQALPIEQVTLFFSSRDFFKGENFAAICVLFNMFKKYIMKRNDKPRLEIIQMIYEGSLVSQLFDNKKLELFKNMNNEKYIHEILLEN